MRADGNGGSAYCRADASGNDTTDVSAGATNGGIRTTDSSATRDDSSIRAGD